MQDRFDPYYQDLSDLADDFDTYDEDRDRTFAKVCRVVGWLLISLVLGTIAAIAFFVTLSAHADTPILMNLAPVQGWSTARPFVDLSNLVRPYGSVAAPWDESVPAASYVNGYPVGDFGGYLDLAGYPTGTYAVTFKGAGKLTWFNAGPATATNVDLIGGKPCWFSVTGTSRADPFRDLHIVRRGDDPAKVFTTDFLADLRGVAAVRMMDWVATNTATPATWAQRQTPAGTQTLPARGVCLEYQILLANQINADLWLCIPDWADDAYVGEMAKMVAAGLKPNLNVYVEVSNECWNGQFPQFNRLLGQARNNPELTAVDQYERLYQHVAYLLRRHTRTFRSVLSGGSPAGTEPTGRVRPVLPGQAVNAWWVDSGLKFLDAKYGPGTAADTVYAVAFGDYWYVKDAAGTTPDALFPSLVESVTVDAAKNLAAHRAVGAKYGVNRVVAYEAGQHLYGGVNKDAHRAMQRDERMGAIYTVGIDQFFKGGGTMWGAFNSTSSWGTAEWGLWGLGETLDDNTPKRKAVRAYYATGIPPPPIRPTPWSPTTRPAFPIAQWEVPAKNMDAAKARGINVLVSPGLEGAKNKATRLAWAAEAAKRGLWVVGDFEGDVPANTYAFLLPDEFDARKADPNVDKWDGWTRAQVRPLYDAFKALAPDLPVFASLSGDHITQANRLAYYKSIADCCDIWSEDWYPYTIDPIRYSTALKAQAIGVLKQAAPDKPVWSVQETCLQNLKGRPNGRQITAAEFRDSVAVTRKAGVAGRMYFSHVFNGNNGWVDWDRTPPDVLAAVAAENATDTPGSTTQPTTQPTTDLAPILAQLDALRTELARVRQDVDANNAVRDGRIDVLERFRLGVGELARPTTQPAGGK